LGSVITPDRLRSPQPNLPAKRSAKRAAGSRPFFLLGRRIGPNPLTSPDWFTALVALAVAVVAAFAFAGGAIGLVPKLHSTRYIRDHRCQRQKLPAGLESLSPFP
jgi:hypothetical protein